MSRVGARREREGVVPRATGVPRLAKPARHARYAREVDPFRVTAPQFRPAFTPGATASAKSWRGLQAALRAGGSRRHDDGRSRRADLPSPRTPGGVVRISFCRAGFAGRDTPLARP